MDTTRPRSSTAESDHRTGPLSGAVEALAVAAAGGQDLFVLVGWIQRSVPGAAHASFTVVRDGSPTTPASTGAIATALDDAQYRNDAGPCLEAARTGRAVPVHDARAETRWQAYVRAAHDNDILSSLSVPVPASGVTADQGLGAALNLYATSPGAFGERSYRAAEAAATVAGRGLTDPDALPSAAARLDQASADGATVSLACRLLAPRAGSEKAAFVELAAEAERSGRPLIAIARRVTGSCRDAGGTAT